MPVKKNIIENLKNKFKNKFKNNKLAKAVELIIQERQKNIANKIINSINEECTNKNENSGRAACIISKKLESKNEKINLSKENKSIEELYNNSFNNKHEITFMSGMNMILYPYYYSTDFDSRSKKFIKGISGPRGSFSSIYLKYYNTKNKIIKSNVIFKLTDWLNNELFGLYFNFLIYKYYESKYPDKLKYLCKLNEFGEVQINNTEKKYYAYMDSCGLTLDKLKTDEHNLSMMLIKELLLQTLESLKLIHDLNYLHLDIKYENYLFTMNKNNELQIKIIDFGYTTKINSEVDDIFGTSTCFPNDWLKNSMAVNDSGISSPKITTLQPHHDFFELGITILEILSLYNIFDPMNNMFCPISYYNVEADIFPKRMNYNLVQHKNDMGTIKEGLSDRLGKGPGKTDNIKIIVDELLFRMVHPEPSERINSVDELLAIVNRIQI